MNYQLNKEYHFLNSWEEEKKAIKYTQPCLHLARSVIEICCFKKPKKYIVKLLKTGKKSLQIFGRDPEFRPEVRETENFTEAINISAIASGLEALNDFLHSASKH